jgi:hypothetical protein
MNDVTRGLAVAEGKAAKEILADLLAQSQPWWYSAIRTAGVGFRVTALVAAVMSGAGVLVDAPAQAISASATVAAGAGLVIHVGEMAINVPELIDNLSIVVRAVQDWTGIALTPKQWGLVSALSSLTAVALEVIAKMMRALDVEKLRTVVYRWSDRVLPERLRELLDREWVATLIRHYNAAPV